MNTTDLQTITPALKALDADSVETPNMPVARFLQEAENLHTWMQRDIAALKDAGLDEGVLDGFQARIGALREAQSEWRAKRNTKEEAQVAYAANAAEAFELLSESLHHIRFAFRRRPDLLSRIPLPSDRSTDDDKFQLMNDLAVIGRENTGLLEACGFDLSLLGRLAQLSDQMANLFSYSEEERRTGRGAKTIRDRAFTFLKEAMDEIRETARFVFRRDPERLDGYRSEYFRQIRSSSTADEIDEEAIADEELIDEAASSEASRGDEKAA